jgi:hypothetical protein
MSAFFPITIRGKDYIIVQKGNIIDISYEHDEEIEVSEEEAEVIIMYLADEGFIS